MQKFYSIVLMATALLIGTNVNATQVVTTVADLADYLGVGAKGTSEIVQLGQDLSVPSDAAAIDIFVKVTDENALTPENAPVRTLDLNGHTITFANSTFIRLFNGTLNIINSNSSKPGAIQFTGILGETYNIDDPGNDVKNPGRPVYLEGSINPNAVNWTTLNVGENVRLIGRDRGVYVYFHTNVTEAKYYTKADKSKTASYNGNQKELTDLLGYNTGWYEKTELGDLTDGSGKYYSGKDQGAAYGLTINIDGYVYGGKYGVQITGQIRQTSTSGNVPQINISSTAEIETAHKKPESAAIYGAGNGNWNIEGNVHGSTGVYIKSGIVDIEGATIASDNNTHRDPTGKTSGVNAGGSAIVIESNKSYGEEIGMTISGNTTVTAASGYAVEEVVTTSPTTKVENFQITGGTFVGGEAGCLTMTATLAEDVKLQDGISGGTYNSKIDEYINNNSGLIAQTTDENGKTVYVIETKPADVKFSRDINVDNDKAYVVWPNDTTVTVAADALAQYLEIDAEGILTVKSGATLTLGSIVLSSEAQVVIEAGAALKIIGKSGIVANQNSNIVIKADANNAGVLMMGPAVESNQQPRAQVQIATPDAKQLSATENKWQRIASPLVSVDKVASDHATNPHELFPGTTTLSTQFKGWDYTIGDWATVKSTNMRPFVGYEVSNNSAVGGVIYTFSGKLQGNITSDIAFVADGYNYFANSFTAPMGLSELLDQLEAANLDMDWSVWTFQGNEASYLGVSKAVIDNFAATYNVASLGTYILNINSNGKNSKVDVNYNATVWGYNNPTAAPAPARAHSDISTMARINVTDMNGYKDQVIVMENGAYNNSYENGVDTRKFMESDKLNFYANGAEKLSVVGTNDLNGTMLSLETLNSEMFTISFSQVMGETLYLKDMVTGIVTEISEGNTYEFMADANAKNDYRFQIIGVNNAPTDVETIEINEGVKEVYTILGQYVGTSDMINALPAGVYVIDGVKIVK